MEKSKKVQDHEISKTLLIKTARKFFHHIWQKVDRTKNSHDIQVQMVIYKLVIQDVEYIKSHLTLHWLVLVPSYYYRYKVEVKLKISYSLINNILQNSTFGSSM